MRKTIQTEIPDPLCENTFFSCSDRPETFDQYIGQETVCRNLKTAIAAAKIKKQQLPHTIFYGPPGLGKTTLANITARQMGVNIKTVNGPNIEKQGELAALLSTLEENDILFIDEIHRIPKAIEEILYSAMEDFRIVVMIGEGQQSKAVTLQLPPFTLIGATTKMGLLSQPLKDRFQIPLHLQYYSETDLSTIVRNTAIRQGNPLEEQVCWEIASVSRQTPRIAIHITKRFLDWLIANHLDCKDRVLARKILKEIGYQDGGLTCTDLAYLTLLKQADSPIGLKTLSAYLGETTDTVEQEIEPYLVRNGYILVTPRGRMLSKERGAEIDTITSR